MVVEAHIITSKQRSHCHRTLGIKYSVSQICSNNDLQQQRFAIRVIENILDRMANQKTLFFILKGKNLGVDQFCVSMLQSIIIMLDLISVCNRQLFFLCFLCFNYK